MRVNVHQTKVVNRKEAGMQRLVSSLIVHLLMIAAVVSVYAQQSAGTLLESGLYKEEVQGDLDAAIKIYERILTDFPTDRPAAASALLHVGLCNEKLGRQEAEKAYRRLIEEFSDQLEPAAMARIRLSNLSSADSKMALTKSTRQVWDAAFGSLYRVSPDGRYLSLVNWQNKGNLAVYDLWTGESRDLTHEGTWEEPNQFSDASVWSPDSRQIAYWWMIGKKGDLRIVGIDGSEPRILYSVDHGKGHPPSPSDWSQDGKFILALLGTENETLEKDHEDHIVLVSVVDGSVRTLKSLGEQHLQSMSLSPDGRYVVYSDKTGDGTPVDIHILATDGSLDEPLLEHPAIDGSPHWTPDGKHVVFGSYRSGSPALWMINVEEGRAKGAPTLIHEIANPEAVMGFTRDGSFYYAIQASRYDVYGATLDFDAGTVLAPPTKISLKFEGSNQAPVWSPDGKQLAYFSRRNIVDPIVLVIRSVQTSEEREISIQRNIKLNFHPRDGLPQWSRDGRSILVIGNTNTGRGLFLVDVETGDITALLQDKPGDEDSGNVPIFPVFSKDGKTVYYVRKPAAIIAHDVESGDDAELYRAALQVGERVGKLALSPNGRQLAFAENVEGEKFILKIMPISGGEPREVLNVDYADLCLDVGVLWTSDGKHLVIAQPEDHKELWMIPVDGGEPRTMALGAHARGLRLHPDGQRIAFMDTEGGYGAEVWALENFLPESIAGK